MKAYNGGTALSESSLSGLPLPPARLFSHSEMCLMSAKTQNGGPETAPASVQQGAALQNANVHRAYIEDTIFDDTLPCNSIAVLDRLKELLEEHGTNSLEHCRNDLRVRKAMWLLVAQFYGELAVVDLTVEWSMIYEVAQ